MQALAALVILSRTHTVTTQRTATLPLNLTDLPTEILQLIIEFLIGNKQGFTSYRLIQGDAFNSPIIIDRTHEAAVAFFSRSRRWHVRFHLPIESAPNILLTCQLISQIAQPFYRRMCMKRVESPPRCAHLLPMLVPEIKNRNVEEVMLVLGDDDNVEYDGLEMLRPSGFGVYPSLKEVVMVVDKDEYVSSQNIGGVVEPCKLSRAYTPKNDFKNFGKWMRESERYKELPSVRFFTEMRISFRFGETFCGRRLLKLFVNLEARFIFFVAGLMRMKKK
ncbi:hypothetical protein PMZ80_007556 [Knufia obscura]|uniref:F-box domain-containing protein n=2 Tax=Knufia TaxID=430999 RepID=A0AAN8INF0_9EURO|nr:hypothetical protein PMZ80_007556 [Knufia obscura]KAK5954097.1 hypothetical protein OHC33_004669 [Knufia fluminis]